MGEKSGPDFDGDLGLFRKEKHLRSVRTVANDRQHRAVLLQDLFKHDCYTSPMNRILNNRGFHVRRVTALRTDYIGCNY